MEAESDPTPTLTVEDKEIACEDEMEADTSDKKSPTNWSWKSGYNQHMTNLLETGFMSDATLILGSNKEKVEVHKLILRKGSSVFYEKFENPEVNELIIEDADSEIFMIMLKCLYTGTSGAMIGAALPVLKLATDYKVTELADQCAKILTGKLTDTNVVNLFNQAAEYGHKKMAASTSEYICKKAWKIMEMDEFLEIDHDRLLDILWRNELMVLDEIQIFGALLKWGNAECKLKNLDPSDSKNIRIVLDQLIGFVRFPLMQGEEFTLKVALTNILTQEELISILLYFQVSIEKRSLIPSGRFNSSARNELKRYSAIGLLICNECDCPKNSLINSTTNFASKSLYPGYCFCP